VALRFIFYVSIFSDRYHPQPGFARVHDNVQGFNNDDAKDEQAAI